MNTNKKLKIEFGQTERFEGMIKGLQRKLDQLAPHPAQILHLAPLFTTTSNGNVITGAFNREGAYKAALDAYYADLPARQELERQIMALTAALNGTGYRPVFDLPELAIA